jgi:hypothetical protein
MASQVGLTSSGRAWPVSRIKWIVGLLMGLVLGVLWHTGQESGPSMQTPIAGEAGAGLLTTSLTLPPGAPTTPSPTPLVTPAPPGAVFALAWFPKPPLDGTGPDRVSAEHGYIELTGQADLPFRAALRDSGYRGPVSDYVLATSVEGPGPYKNNAAACKPGYHPNDNNLAWGVDDFCTYIHPHESWFLHNSRGERITGDYAGDGHWQYLMNPADSGWRSFAYGRLREIRDKLGYDGLRLDNLDLDLHRARLSMRTSDGHVQEFGDDTAWRAAMHGWLAGLRARLGAWPVWANLTSGEAGLAWDAYLPYLDGGLEESFAVHWLDGWDDPATWAADLDRAETWLAAGKSLIMVGQGARDDLERMRFTLASYMLVAHADQAFYRYSRYDTYYHEMWLYPEFDTARALGAPAGSRREIQPGLWRRTFAHGYVEVNLAAHRGQLVLTGP